MELDWAIVAGGLGIFGVGGLSVLSFWVFSNVNKSPGVIPQSKPADEVIHTLQLSTSLTQPIKVRKHKHYGRIAYWRINPKGGPGKDQDGRTIYGKTWVAASPAKDTRP